MGKSLEVAKPILEKELRSDFEKILEEAFYEALKATDDNETYSFNKLSPDISHVAKLARDKTDKKFKNAAKKFSEEASPKLAKQISQRVYDFIKEIMITVNASPITGTISSPVGPCAGIINITPNFFQIN